MQLIACLCKIRKGKYGITLLNERQLTCENVEDGGDYDKDSFAAFFLFQNDVISPLKRT